MHSRIPACRCTWGKRRGFSLAELLVVIGIIALLIAVILPPVYLAHQQARATRCVAQEQQIGVALESTLGETGYYPIWDDAVHPVRHTWVDVLVQRRTLGYERTAYCPEDPAPGPINSARSSLASLIYPQTTKPGIDYSYGITMPLSAAGWSWRPGFGNPDYPRRLVDHDRLPSSRVLSIDASWSVVYNLGGFYLQSHDWSYPTQFDNTVDWRHARASANALFQDGHVERLRYDLGRAAQGKPAIDTSRYFVWYRGEALSVGPADQYNGNYYPNRPPADIVTGRGSLPTEIIPGYYTHNHMWTNVIHK